MHSSAQIDDDVLCPQSPPYKRRGILSFPTTNHPAIVTGKRHSPSFAHTLFTFLTFPLSLLAMPFISVPRLSPTVSVSLPVASTPPETLPHHPLNTSLLLPLISGHGHENANALSPLYRNLLVFGLLFVCLLFLPSAICCIWWCQCRSTAPVSQTTHQLPANPPPAYQRYGPQSQPGNSAAGSMAWYQVQMYSYDAEYSDETTQDPGNSSQRLIAAPPATYIV